MPKIDLSTLKEFQPVKGYRARMVHTDGMTLAYWEIDGGASLPEHSHPHEQVVNVIEGKFELVVDGAPHELESGKVFVIPGDVPHSGRAITDCKIIDAFHPVREDYK